MPVHKTNAGVDWIGRSVFQTVKITLDSLTVEYFVDRGYGEEEIREQWGKLCPGSGFMSKRNQEDFRSRVAYLVPDFEKQYDQVSTHSEGLGGL